MFMKRLCRVLSLAITFVLVATIVYSSGAVSAEVAGGLLESDIVTPVDGKFADNRVLVVLTNEASLRFEEYTADNFAELDCVNVADLSQASGRKVQALVESERSIAAKTADIPIGGIISPSDYHQILCLELENHGEQYVAAAIKTLLEREDVLYAEPDYVMSLCSVTPNDTNYTYQTAAGIIDLPEAWTLTKGSADVVVGVIDSGIYGNHEDLSANVDFARSRDFRSGYSVAENPPTGTDNHGTHVAGIIGAVGNNQKGIAGVCWDVTLVSLKIFNSDGNGFSSHLIAAIEYAEGINIPILNFSGRYTSGNEYLNDGGTMRSAIQNYSGLLVCAAGNDESNNDVTNVFPGGYNDLKNVITVGSSTMSDTRSSFSNYGRTKVDLFAPGEGILSTISTDAYTTDWGTSMAAPYVTGTAALLLARDSQLLPCEMKDIIMRTVDDCGTTFDNECVSGGRLNVYKALQSSSRHTSTCTNRNNGTHTRMCSTCGSSAVRPHDYENIYKHNTSQHRIACDCGASIYETHLWNGSRTRCLVCGYNTSGLGTID